MEALVTDKVTEAVRSCQNELLTGINTLIASEVQKITSNLLKQRQKVIRIADESEMGWKVVDEYIQSEVV